MAKTEPRLGTAMKLLLPAAAAVIVLVAMAGCSGSPSGPVTPTMKDGKYVIHMTAGNQFAPSAAKVPVGAVVQWVTDGNQHDVHGDDGLASPGGTGALTVGMTYEHTFSTAGTYHYHCELHAGSGMTGTLTVE
jgi:plastocyanin